MPGTTGETLSSPLQGEILAVVLSEAKSSGGMIASVDVTAGWARAKTGGGGRCLSGPGLGGRCGLAVPRVVARGALSGPIPASH